MKLIKPKALKPGDTLGIAAFSTPISAGGDETIQRSYEFLRNKGFNLVEAPNCRKLVGHAAGTVKERVKTLHDFFRNSKIDGILAFWGGMNSHQILEYLDFDLIRRHPKAFIGFSDLTSLQVAIHAKTGLVTFSGPGAITFGKPMVPDFTWEHFERILMKGEAPLRIGVSSEFSDNKWYREPEKKMRFKANEGLKVYRKGNAQGAIIGGNIGTMLLLAGTSYWPKMKGKILFFEDDEVEDPRTIDRMFTQLRHMKVFDQIKGLVVGRFPSSVGFKSEDSLEMILDDALRGYKFPVITGADFGHTDPLITFPMGVKCRMDTKRMEIVFLESGVKR
jgi:muramoyltetrapeptide carboxypeptidase